MSTVVLDANLVSAEVDVEENERTAIIAERLARFNETMELIRSMPDHRAAAGAGPITQNIRELAYEEREAAIL